MKGYVHAPEPQEHSVYESKTPMLNGTRSGFLRPLDNVVGNTAEQSVLDILQREAAVRQSAIERVHWIPNLRNSRAPSDGREWANIGLPTSTFNEAVHPRYRVRFDKLKK